MTLQSDRVYLRELVEQVNDGVILEIGSYTGNSARAMGEVAKVPMYCIDLWDLTYPDDRRLRIEAVQRHMRHDAFDEFVKNTAGLDIIPVKGISSEIAKVWDKQIGLLFIDGDHSYDGCLADYVGFARHIITGGYLVFHDYIEDRKGVIKAVDEIKQFPQWTDWTLRGHSTISARRI